MLFVAEAITYSRAFGHHQSHTGTKGPLRCVVATLHALPWWAAGWIGRSIGRRWVTWVAACRASELETHRASLCADRHDLSRISKLRRHAASSPTTTGSSASSATNTGRRSRARNEVRLPRTTPPRRSRRRRPSKNCSTTAPGSVHRTWIWTHPTTASVRVRTQVAEKAVGTSAMTISWWSRRRRVMKRKTTMRCWSCARRTRHWWCVERRRRSAAKNSSTGRLCVPAVDATPLTTQSTCRKWSNSNRSGQVYNVAAHCFNYGSSTCLFCPLTRDLFYSLLRPVRGPEYCDQFVCLSASISLESQDRSSRIFFAQIPCGRGSVLLLRRCDMLCTSGFMDDVTFGRMAMRG